VEAELDKLLDLIHELRTFLNGIFGGLSLVLDGSVEDEAERSEFLQSAQQFALHVMELVGKFSNIDTLFPSPDQLSHEERQKLERLISEFCRGAEALAAAVSDASEAIVTDPTNLAPVQAALNQALFELNLLNDLLDEAKPFLPVGGYFSTLRTKVKDPQLLILALEQLGLTVALDADVRGGANQRVRADIVAVLEGECDIGWLRNANGSFDLIADMVALEHGSSNIVELINSINQQYERNASLE
jgi:signal transduction histidine kinase